jgi:PAS domain S-box-containing protein
MSAPQLNRKAKARDGLKRLTSVWGSETNGYEPAEEQREVSHCPLVESAPPFESVFQTNRQGVLGMDMRGRCTFINQLAAEMLGLNAEKAVGRKLHWVVRSHGDNGSFCSADPFPNYLAYWSAKPGRVERGMLCRRDGSSFPAEYSFFALIEDGMIQGMVMTFVNTLERERLEVQFRQAQKMEAIGRLAGGIAHDFNNLLTAILGYSELMRAGISNSEPLYHEIVEINKAAQRAASLTSQLLNFSRKQDIAPQCLDLNVLLADMEGMVRRLLGKDVELSMALDPSLACIKADQGQMEQVVLNLAVNARDAMPRGGKLAMTTANVKLDLGDPHSDPPPPVGGGPGGGLRAGSFVMLAAKDTGCGMDEETMVRIFEPFFTTKGPGQGTGMGLATVLGIVQESQGFIDVDSRPGEGTTFRIYLPRLAEMPETVKAVSPQVAARGGSETVLLVEDEDTLCQLVQSILGRYGYHVLKAQNAAEALRIGQRHPEPIHLMLADLIMSQMSGQQLTEQMALLRPEMKVLYMSGSADDTITRACLSEKNIALIRKPFTPIALARKVREILDEESESS